MVYAWDMNGLKPSFKTHRELTTLELPKGTVLEIELVHEMTGEVSTILYFRNVIGSFMGPFPFTMLPIILWERFIVG